MFKVIAITAGVVVIGAAAYFLRSTGSEPVADVTAEPVATEETKAAE